MGNRKKLRRKFYNGEIKLQDLSEDDAKYLEKHIRKMQRDLQDSGTVPTFKEMPCQKWPGKTVLVSENAVITTGEDGLLYADDKLIVSENWKSKESARKAAESREARKETEQAVTELKPTRLGED